MMVEIYGNVQVQWNFLYSLGLTDDRHFTLQAPASTGSDYCNYKSEFSIVDFLSNDAG
jgi:hypothetical protein